MNAEQASKWTTQKPTSFALLGRLPLLGKRAKQAPSSSAGVVAMACVQEEDRSNTGKPYHVVGCDDQPDAREGQAGRGRVADRPDRPLTPV